MPTHGPLGGQPIVPPVDLAREPWRLLAACLHHPTLPPETWDDAVTGERANPHGRARRVAAAVAVCRTCPVQELCRRDVDLEWDSGVRGGVDLRELQGGGRQR